jgi:NADH dehydrogenase [ubiquinone] 1 alpha subcomplex assembly factor 7
MTNFVNKITTHINTHGFISIDNYMLLVAEYYYSNLKVFGKKSDFITAPEISNIFGQTLGKWLLNTHLKLGSPSEFCIVELGGGSGKMLYDLLTYLGDEFLINNKINIHIIEKSKSLKKLQSETLKSFTNLTINWHEEVKDLPNILTFVLANEFFDALPIKQYIKREGDWFEVVIKLTNEQNFYFDKIILDAALNQLLKNKYPHAQTNAIIEESPQTLAMFSHLCNHLKQSTGAMLVVDYGYEYNPQTRKFFNSTLQAIKAHKFCDIFENIGNADITAHVDFHELINTAKLAKCNVAQSLTQSRFLFKAGIAEVVQQHLEKLSPEEQSKLNFSLNRLLSPEQMGSIFRAIEVYSLA